MPWRMTPHTALIETWINLRNATKFFSTIQIVQMMKQGKGSTASLVRGKIYQQSLRVK